MYHQRVSSPSKQRHEDAPAPGQRCQCALLKHIVRVYSVMISHQMWCVCCRPLYQSITTSLYPHKCLHCKPASHTLYTRVQRAHTHYTLVPRQLYYRIRRRCFSLPKQLKRLHPRAMRSALGIRRIADVDVSQVLRATDADILRLRSVLQQWKVPNFRSWPLMLRALTHPSISNWAERTLNLRKRSLGPNTLELLGDRVVGTSVALQLLRWLGRDDAPPSLGLANGARPSALVRALVGNRGLAFVATQIGIHSLLRWEKPLPPHAHRDRLDPSGVDCATGFTCNTDINALANAYEAVAAAVYLDSAFPAAHLFVRHSLLHHVQAVQHANMEVPELQETLVRDLTAVLKQQVSFVATRKRASRSAMLPIDCFEPLQCEILDLEPKRHDRREHDLFYCAVAIRTKDQLVLPFKETDFLCVASHFSVETARMAALEQAIELINGARTPCTPVEHPYTNKVHLQMRKCVFGEEVPTMEAHFLNDGRWQHDADYRHVASLLERVGAPDAAVWHKLDGQQIQNRIQAMRRSTNEQADGWAIHGDRYGAFYGRHKSAVRSDYRSQGDPVVCPSAVSRCMALGTDLALNTELARRHAAPFRDIEDADRVVQQVTNSADELCTLSVQERNMRVKAYHVLGNNAVKLWSVQSSMQDASQERVQVVAESEQRAKMSQVMQRALLGDRGMADVEDLRVNSAYVAIGMCVDSVGCSSAMAWLSGAEQIAGRGRER